MKRIVYLSFYYEPDLCAGSFRNTPLIKELSRHSDSQKVIIELYTTMPNRYSSYVVDAMEYEEIDNLKNSVREYSNRIEFRVAVVYDINLIKQYRQKTIWFGTD